MTTTLNFGIVAGLTAAEQQQLSDLAEAYTYHQSRPHQSEDDALSYVQLFDGNAWAGMKSALGL